MDKEVAITVGVLRADGAWALGAGTLAEAARDAVLPLALWPHGARTVPCFYAEYTDSAETGIAWRRGGDAWRMEDADARRFAAWRAELAGMGITTAVAASPGWRVAGARAAFEVVARVVPDRWCTKVWAEAAGLPYHASAEAERHAAVRDAGAAREALYYWKLALGVVLGRELGGKVVFWNLGEPVWTQAAQAPGDGLGFVVQVSAAELSDDVGDFEVFVFADAEAERVVTVWQTS